jgi:hypothetical protein
MNRIILIGNGFDLAHGLKTSYKHFLEWFKRNKIVNNPNDYFEYVQLSKTDPYFGTDKPLASSFFKYHYGNFNNLDNFISHDGESKFVYKAKFFETLIQKTTLQNWVDIEEEYYIALNQCLSKKNEGEVGKLNNALLVIQKALEEYLILQTKNSISPLPMISQKINSIIEPPSEGETLFLNFNYTNTEKLYIQSNYPNNTNQIRIIHIHGELEKTDNPIIFGYGDELDDKYKLIENENKNVYLENIKSIKYLETDNYRLLRAFIEDDHYEIFVMGHSCGISDRTLLNTLFEHKNCSYIGVSYHKKEDGTDNFSDVIRNISRNFNDKRLMRERVLNRTSCEPLL